MLFNSFEFILLFLPLTCIIYFWLNRKRLLLMAKTWLVVASLFFYAWWDIKYLPLIIGSMLFNFALGTALVSGRHRSPSVRKGLLVFGIVANVALLGYYKYTDFAISIMNDVLGRQYPALDIILPLGISFFTFTQIAFLVDAYRSVAHEYDLLNYSLFVTFFPHLLAGPIIHHKEMMPQFASLRNSRVQYRNIAQGLFLFFLGMTKKVILADHLARWAKGFDNGMHLSLLEAWTASLSYTFQIYFDFSGYTDMAIGAALLFNIWLPFNFNSPYKALDIQDFWRRWHMTLSRFLRDYIYIPLGGNRHGSGLTSLNLMATFLIGGLWHGAAWTFVFWGFLHGAAIVVHRIWKRMGGTMPRWLAWFVTFNFVNITWVFFRAKTWDDAIRVIAGMTGLNGTVLPDALHRIGKLLHIGAGHFGRLELVMRVGNPLPFFVAAFAIIALRNSNHLVGEFRPRTSYLVATLLMTLVTIPYLSRATEFLYFNF